MIRIDTDQLDELIHKDKEIQKELTYHLKDETKMYDVCYEKLLEQQKRLEEVKQQRNDLEKRTHEYLHREEKFHSKINHLEIQKIFKERKLKRISKKLAKCQTEEEHQELLQEYANVQQEILEINHNQDQIRGEIRKNSLKIKNIERQDTELKELEEDIERDLETSKKNVVEWQLAIETKTNLFYQKTFDTMMTYYDPLKDLLVRNLQHDKGMTKDEAKKKTDGIIIEPGEEILVDPPGYVKRLTKQKQEEYQNVEKM